MGPMAPHKITDAQASRKATGEPTQRAVSVAMRENQRETVSRRSTSSLAMSNSLARVVEFPLLPRVGIFGLMHYKRALLLVGDLAHQRGRVHIRVASDAQLL